MKRCALLSLLCLAAWRSTTFVAGPSLSASRGRAEATARRAVGLEFLREPLEAYAAARVADSPFLAEAPEAALHWGHAAAMASVYPQLAFGAFLGWQIRLGKGQETTPVSMGFTSATLHPLLSIGAFLFFLVGGQGGLVLLTAQKQTILDSPHAVTALLGLSLLALQAVLPLFFQETQLRTTHAFLGSFIVLLMLVHAALGLSLGFSF